MEKIRCSIGVAAYNEEANIGRLLERLLAQELQTVEIAEIVVVASGCADNTEGIVRQWMGRDDRIRLFSQATRQGKIAAVNLFMEVAETAVLILCSADLLPAPDAIEKLAAPFADPELGMAASRPVPINPPDTFMGFAAHLLWDLHHEINLISFKAGEMVAFRRVFTRIPVAAVVDEASIEPLIRGQGYRVQYVGDAIVYNKGPETVADFLRQRRRNHAGHLIIKQTLGYSVGTMSSLKILTLLLRQLDWRPKQFAWTWAVVALEGYGRFLGHRDVKKQRDHTVWEMATTTKELTQ